MSLERQLSLLEAQSKSMGSNSLDAAAGILSNVTELLVQKSLNKQQQEEKVDMAILQILSTQVSDARSQITKYDEWMAQNGMYDLIPEKDKTGVGADWINELKSGTIKTYDDLQDHMGVLVDDIGSSMQLRKDILSDYTKGQKEIQVIEDTYANIMPTDDPYEDYMLTGDVQWIGGEPIFEKGSELAAIFDPASIGGEIELLEGIKVMSDTTEQQNKLDAIFGPGASMNQLNEKLADQKSLYAALGDAGLDLDEGLDEDIFKSEAFTSGFDAGSRTTQIAQDLSRSNSLYRDAQLKEMVGEYDAAAKIYSIQGNLLGQHADNAFVYNMGVLGGGQKYTINDIVNLAGGDDAAKETYVNVWNSINKYAPTLLPRLQAMEKEAAIRSINPSGETGYDSSLYLVHLLNETTIKHGELASRLAISAGVTENDPDYERKMTNYINKNKDSFLVRDYTDIQNLLQEFKYIGMTVKSIGSSIVKDISKNFNARELNKEKIIDRVSGFVGIGDQITDAEATNLENITEGYDILSAFDKSKTQNFKTDNEIINLLASTSDYVGKHTNISNKFQESLGSTTADEKADIISSTYGLDSWYAYGDIDNFKNAAKAEIANQLGHDSRLEASALNDLENMFRSLTMAGGTQAPTAAGMRGEGTGWQPIGYGAASTYHLTPQQPGLGPLYDLFDKLEMSLNQLETLNLSEGILTGEEIIKGE